MSFETIFMALRECENSVSKAVSLYKEIAEQFDLNHNEYECEKLWIRFPKTIVSNGDSQENLYITLFVVLDDKKIVLALIHDVKDIDENKLVEISASTRTCNNSYGILPNSEYLGSNSSIYDTKNLPSDKIVFRKQYIYTDFYDEDCVEEFKKDCHEVFSLHECILKHLKMKGYKEI